MVVQQRNVHFYQPKWLTAINNYALWLLFPCGTEGSEFVLATLKGSVMSCALRWEETWWEPHPVPICWLKWSFSQSICIVASETGITANIRNVPLYADDLSFYMITCAIHFMSHLFQALKDCWRWNTQDWLNKSPHTRCGDYAQMRLLPLCPKPCTRTTRQRGASFCLFLGPYPFINTCLCAVEHARAK